MKKPTQKRKSISINLDDVLAEAMRQPGVAAVVEAYEASDKFNRPVTEYNALVEWQRFRH